MLLFQKMKTNCYYVHEKIQKDLNNNWPHEAKDFIQNSSWKLG